MHSASRIGLDDLLIGVSGRMTRWALGFGLLSLHATLFALTMVGLVFWNIYASPRDLWVGDVARNWGAVLAFHTISVTAGTIAWRLLRAEREALTQVQQPWVHAVAGEPAPRAIAQPVAAPVWQPVQAQPRRAQQVVASVVRVEQVARRTAWYAVASSAPALRKLSTTVSAGAGRIFARNGKQTPARAAVDPTVTWPQAVLRHTPEDEAFITKFAGAEVSAAGAVTQSGEDVVIDLAGVTPIEQNGGSAMYAKGPGQTWVETATFAWQLHRETHDPAPDGEQPSELENGRGTPPSQ